jgi:hypothetical protein
VVLSETEKGEELTHGDTHEFPPSLASYDNANQLIISRYNPVKTTNLARGKDISDNLKGDD